MATTMQCPNSEDGVHVLGTRETFSCGYSLKIPRFMFSLEVYDNDAKKDLASEGFNCSHIESVVEKLRRIADTLEMQK